MTGTWSWDAINSKFAIDPAARQISGFPSDWKFDDFDDLVDRTTRAWIKTEVWSPLLQGWVANTEPFVKTFEITPFGSNETIWIRSTIIFERSLEPRPWQVPEDAGWGIFRGRIDVLQFDPDKLVYLDEHRAAISRPGRLQG